MTVEEFFELPEPVGEFTYELHFGELVQVGRAKKKHVDLQELIREIFARSLDQKLCRIRIEMPYSLTPGYDARAADVGVVLRKRWDAIADDDYLIGSPDLIVLMKVRSNIEEVALSHIAHGATA